MNTRKKNATVYTNNIEKNLKNNKYKQNPYPSGTDKYYKCEATNEGFKTPQEWARWHINNNPVCRYCKTPKGFAMGTGDCGCEGDNDGQPRWLPNPKRDK